MTAFIESSRAIQIHIVAGAIILMCFFIILYTQQQHHHAPIRHKIISIAGTVIFFFIFVILIFVRKQMIAEAEISAIPKYIVTIPVAVYFAAFAAGLLVLIYEHIYDVQKFRSSLSEYSILQAVNNLNDGLVIVNRKKRIVFANQKMYELSFAVFGQSLYCAGSFSEWIEDGFCAENVYCLPQLPHAAYYLPNGEVWQIRRLTITVDGENYTEFVASEITRQYALRREIERENSLLKKRQKVMADSAKMIIESNVKEEQLAYKMRIHDLLGQCIVTVSHIMKDTGDAQKCAKMWKETVEGLRTYGEDSTSGDDGQRALREQLQLIEQFGCTVKHEGPIPEHSLQSRIFRDAIRTAAINAVRHAGADTIFVKTKQKNSGFNIVISDNGKAEAGQLIEGGGLSSLRRKVENAGGTMEITAGENIKICIQLPSSGGG